MLTDDQRDRAKKGIKARQDAVKTLIANHQEEFDKLHSDNRLALGLPRLSAGATPEVIQKRLDRVRAQMEKWERELELARSAS